MGVTSREPVGFARAWLLALLTTLSLASSLMAVCSAGRPERDLWIEIVSCSDGALKDVSDELVLQAFDRTDGVDYSRSAVPRAAELLRQSPGFLVEARVLAFAESTKTFMKRGATGKMELAMADRPGEWQRSELEPAKRYFLASAASTCEALKEPGRVVVREVFRCCDTGRGPELGCILQVSELVTSTKTPPTDKELSPSDP
ncbi:MAG: hypothetical protein ABI689_16140 [Thermoanaerobaculia bacterium]